MKFHWKLMLLHLYTSLTHIPKYRSLYPILSDLLKLFFWKNRDREVKNLIPLDLFRWVKSSFVLLSMQKDMPLHLQIKTTCGSCSAFCAKTWRKIWNLRSLKCYYDQTQSLGFFSFFFFLTRQRSKPRFAI